METQNWKFKVWLVNFGYYLQDEFDTLDEAVKHAKSKSFEYRVDQIFPSHTRSVWVGCPGLYERQLKG